MKSKVNVVIGVRIKSLNRSCAFVRNMKFILIYLIFSNRNDSITTVLRANSKKMVAKEIFWLSWLVIINAQPQLWSYRWLFTIIIEWLYKCDGWFGSVCSSSIRYWPNYFLCKAAVSNFGSGFVFKPDKRRFNSAIARPGFKPWNISQLFFDWVQFFH